VLRFLIFANHSTSGGTVGQVLKLGGGQKPFGRRDWGRQLGVGLFLIKSVIAEQ
jgi:hypothetical protein